MAKAVTAITGIALQLVVLLDPLGDFEAGNLGQLDVHQDQVGPVLARQLQRLHAVLGLQGVVAVGFEQIVEELHVELVVLDDEHRLPALGIASRIGTVSELAHLALSPRKSPTATISVPHCHQRNQMAIAQIALPFSRNAVILSGSSLRSKTHPAPKRCRNVHRV